MRESFWLHLTGGENKEDILALHIAHFAQTLAECLPEVHALCDGAGRKNADPWDFLRLLRLSDMNGSQNKNRERIDKVFCLHRLSETDPVCLAALLISPPGMICQGRRV